MHKPVAGFCGQRRDPQDQTYSPGNGYRTYSGGLMHFRSPDDASPFGPGGLNPYAYCEDDPVNHSDPSGHLSWQAGVGIGLGIAGLLLAVVTDGLSVAAAGGVMAAIDSASAASLAVGTVGIASDVSAIASGSLEAQAPRLSAILGWTALGTGAIGLSRGLYTLARSGLRTMSGVGRRLATLKETGLSGRGAVAAGRSFVPALPNEMYRTLVTNIHEIRTLKNVENSAVPGMADYAKARRQAIMPRVATVLQVSRMHTREKLETMDDPLLRLAYLHHVRQSLPLPGYTERATHEFYLKTIETLPDTLRERFLTGQGTPVPLEELAFTRDNRPVLLHPFTGNLLDYNPLSTHRDWFLFTGY